MGVYEEGNFRPWHGYVYVTAVTFASVTLSMYCLVLFYFIMEKDLAVHSPLAKFCCVKAILFFSFWQGVFIAVLAYYDVLPDSVGKWTQDNISRGLQDFIVCIEMAILALAHGYVFAVEEYGDIQVWESCTPKEVVAQPVKNFARHVVNQKDVVQDIKHAYSPSNLSAAKIHHKNLKKEYRSNQKLAMHSLDMEMDPSPLIDSDEPADEPVSLAKSAPELPEIRMTTIESSQETVMTTQLEEEDTE